MATETELKPCPFCGGTENLDPTSYDFEIISIVCPCGGEGPAGATEAEAVRLWNERKEK